MRSSVRTLALALATLVVLSAPMAASAHTSNPVRLEIGRLYNLVMSDGNNTVIRGDNQSYNVEAYKVSIALNTIPEVGEKARYTPNFGDPEPFYAWIPASDEMINSWVSDDPFKGNLLREGVIYAVTMTDGNAVVIRGDNRSYNVLLFKGQFNVIPTQEQHASFQPNAGDPESGFYAWIPASSELIASWQTH
jgi:hypothetical protein